jgi:hypothetical protein
VLVSTRAVSGSIGSHSLDQYGNYQHRDFQLLLATPPSIVVSNTIINDHEPDFESLCPKFGWCSSEIIKKTFENTTQFACSVTLYGDMRKHYKTRFPAFNVARRSETVATDTIYADTPTIDNGARCAQIFVGRETLVADIYAMKTDKEFVSVLEDNIRYRGAMSQLISDRATAEQEYLACLPYR